LHNETSIIVFDNIMEQNYSDQISLTKLQNKRLPLKRAVPLFEEHLPPNYRGINFPQALLIRRNLSIIAIFIQIASSCAGLTFYFMRRTALYLIVNMISMLISAQGLYGVICMQKINIVIHAVATSGILGVFFLYFFLESFFNRHLAEATADYKYSERSTMILMSIPYLIDFLSGLVTFNFTYYIFKEEEFRAKLDAEKIGQEEMKEIDGDEYSSLNYDPASDLCIICSVKIKKMVIYPCGHVIFCQDCVNAFKAKGNNRCPICRVKVVDIIPTFK